MKFLSPARWAFLLLPLCGPALIKATDGAKPRYDVAAFVWPSYHPDSRARIFWPMGMGEWETVLNNTPKFPGQQQPRRPLWGYVNEADPNVMEMEIAAAADHGVNVFIYDWYWYDGLPFLEGSLDHGFLAARNRGRMKFYLMWANHDATLLWDKRNADEALRGNRAPGGATSPVIWRGGPVGRFEFERAAHRIIGTYFSQPEYYTIDGKPAFMFFDLKNLVVELGGMDGARAALDWFRAETVKAGHPGLELQMALRQRGSHPLASVPGSENLTQEEIVKRLGFDSATHYQWVSMGNVDRDYQEVRKDVTAEWEKSAQALSIPYYPQVSQGWDASPRGKTFVGPIIKNGSPAEFEQALRAAKEYADRHPKQAPLITVNSWNEWTESSYLQPDELNGYENLEAVQRVFDSDAGK